jgi:transcriptional regulator with XRE-family HTH domain
MSYSEKELKKLEFGGENLKSIVAHNAKIIISNRCLKQCAIAKKAGYSNQQFNDLLNGRKVMRDTDVSRIAEALDVEPNILFGVGKEYESICKTLGVEFQRFVKADPDKEAVHTTSEGR